MIADDSAGSAEVSQAINDALIRYFHPLTGGEDKSGWPFGGTVFYSRVYQQVFLVEGVASISSLTIVLDGTEYPGCTDVPIGRHGLLYSVSHSVDVSYPVDGGDQ